MRVSATLVAKDLAGGHGHRTLFEGLDLTVAPGDVVGVVGANGAGKTTLLRILAGDLEPHDGTVSTAPSDAFVGWLPQEHERIPGETVAAYVGRRTGASGATAAMEAAAEALGSGEPGVDDAYAVAFDRWMTSGAPDLDERIPPLLADLGLDVGPDALMTSLSGGQAARAALAALLLSRFDVVLLDEPTNDLDLAGLDRLEAFVHGLRSGVVLVSHDREFLSRCVTRIVELDLPQNQVTVYDGGYDSFLEERAVARRHAREAYDEFADKKADLVGRARTQREWSSQGVRNAMKKNPDNDKMRRKAASESSEKQAQKVRQMESRIARMEEVEEPRKEWVLQFSIGSAPPLERGRRDPQRGDAAAWRLPARTGLAAGQRSRPDRHHRAQRRRQDHLDPAAARPGAARQRHRQPRCVGRDRRDRPGAHRSGRGPPARRRRGSGSAGARRPPTYAPCWRSSVSRPTRSPARSGASRRESAPAPRSHCSRVVGSTCWCSTSRPTISTCRRSSSSRRRWRATTARSCWSRTTGGCSTTSAWTDAGVSWTAS